MFRVTCQEIVGRGACAPMIRSKCAGGIEGACSGVVVLVHQRSVIVAAR
jgi:hypothetical protein